MDTPSIEILLIMYLNCAFEIFLLFIFLNGLFQVYEEKKWIIGLESFICVTVLFFINSYGLPWLNLICVPIIFFVFVQLVFRLEIKYALLYVIFFYVIGAVTEFVSTRAYNLFEIDVMTIDFGRLFILVVQDIISFVIIMVTIRFHQVPYEKSSYRYLKSLFILPITTLILLNGYLFSDTNRIMGSFLICIGGILLIFSNMISFVLLEILLKALNEAKAKEMLEMKSLLEKQHYQRLKEANENYGRYIHEVRRLLRTMEQLVYSNNESNAKGLLEEFSQKEYPVRKIYSGNPIMDAILAEREKLAEHSGINFKANIQPGINLEFIDDIDKISMFGNLLDNAIEAATATDKGYVFVNLFEGNDALTIFEVENNFKYKARKFGKEYLTIKKMKKEHGFGLSIVKSLSEKYGGMFDTSEKENIFTALLVLSNMSNPVI